MSAPRRIDPVFVERVWGRHDLAPLYGRFDRKIGEVWFPVSDAFPLLVKFIFTDERLSVQVHPDDAYARERHPGSRGKTEMWHILAAQPGATIALGFERPVSKEELRRAIADGSVERLLHWVKVEAGDTVFTPAGVVHAIGPGVTLCEIQQNSDITYRLYDYGRPRELHLEHGLEVSRTEPYEGRTELPVVCDQFTTDGMRVRGDVHLEPSCDRLLIGLEGAASVGGVDFGAGEVVLAPGGQRHTVSSQEGARLLVTRCLTGEDAS